MHLFEVVCVTICKYHSHSVSRMLHRCVCYSATFEPMSAAVNTGPPLAAGSEGASPSVMEPSPDRPAYLRVVPRYAFHLHINTAPCGDARIFSPHEEEAEASDPHTNRWLSKGVCAVVASAVAVKGVCAVVASAVECIISGPCGIPPFFLNNMLGSKD